MILILFSKFILWCYNINNGQFLNYNISSIFIFWFYINSRLFKGKCSIRFPWNLWAYSGTSLNEIIQILNVIGLYAFNLLTITLFTLPAVIFFLISNFKKITVYFDFFINFLYTFMELMN